MEFTMSKHDIRFAAEADLPQINAIFNHYVATSTCVWTTHPYTDQERKAWFDAHDATTPVLVAEKNGNIVGWGALSRFQTACTFHRTAENSVYVHPEFQRQGIGRQLLFELMQCARQAGHVSIIAAISADQAPSIALHNAAGFRQVGLFRKVGYKFNRYYDVLYMQRHLENR